MMYVQNAWKSTLHVVGIQYMLAVNSMLWALQAPMLLLGSSF
jgi:hypothetical protein